MVEPEKRPRHFAVDITDAWVRGEPTADILAGLPENIRGLAATHARLLCEQIKYHRRVQTPIEQIKGRQLSLWVEIYTARLSSK